MTTEALLFSIVAAPGAAFLFFALAWLVGFPLSERWVARITAGLFGLLTLAVVTLGLWMGLGSRRVVVTMASWFEVGTYHFPLTLLADRLSFPLIALTVILVGLVGSFSVRYMHRDPGFYRFFVLLHLFAFGALLLFAAGSIDLFIAGWEVVGITSVLLIAFFHQRPDPVRNAIRVFATYRVADLGLLSGVFVAHHVFGAANWGALFQGEWPAQTTAASPSSATAIAALLLISACGKSAQGPFLGWLPRAMEGPTPSSAIFYGAISVHAGAYLLLRAGPLLERSPLVAMAAAAVGLGTALLGTLVHRTCTDAKTSLAWASMTQLGIIFAEIALGWWWLALVHMTGHAVVRTLQFLRAPSMLHDYHRVHSAAGGHLARTGKQYQLILPAGARAWLYRAGVERGYYDAMVDRLVVAPVLRLAGWLAGIEPKWGGPDTAGRVAGEVTGGVDA